MALKICDDDDLMRLKRFPGSMATNIQNCWLNQIVDAKVYFLCQIRIIVYNCNRDIVISIRIISTNQSSNLWTIINKNINLFFKKLLSSKIRIQENDHYQYKKFLLFPNQF